MNRRIILLFLCVSLGFEGCLSTMVRLDTSPAYQELLDADVNQIDAIDLGTFSETEPISIEDAAEEYMKETPGRKAPPAQIALSLADIRAAALTNNLDLKVELVNPSIAQEMYNEERAKFEALFFGSVYHGEMDSPTASGLEGTQATYRSYELGIQKPLRTGGQASLSLPLSKLRTNNPFSLLDPAYEADLKFSISQPLLRGAGTHTNTHSIRVAQLQKKIADAGTKLEAIRILAAADKGYWMVYAASRELGVRRQQHELALRQLREAEIRVKAKAAAPVEITRAESGVAARVEGIITASTYLRLRERELKRIMNRPDLPIESYMAIVPTSDPNPLGLSLDPDAIANFGVENRMEMLETELQLAIDGSVIDFERNARLPLFLLDYIYNINGLGTSYRGANEQMACGRFADWSIGLRTEIPIGNKAAKARVRQALLTRVQRLATKEQRQQVIVQEVFNAVDLLQQNWQRILAARQEVVFAGRTYQAERRQFELGVRTSTDVLDAAARLAEAQLREIYALVEYQIAQIDIAFATGTLLGHAKIRWEPIDL